MLEGKLPEDYDYSSKPGADDESTIAKEASQAAEDALANAREGYKTVDDELPHFASLVRAAKEKGLEFSKDEKTGVRTLKMNGKFGPEAFALAQAIMTHNRKRTHDESARDSGDKKQPGSFKLPPRKPAPETGYTQKKTANTSARAHVKNTPRDVTIMPSIKSLYEIETFRDSREQKRPKKDESCDKDAPEPAGAP